MSRSPDYKLKIKINEITNKDSTLAGVAWVNEDKSITIVLNPAISMNYSDNLLIKLFPVDKTQPYSQP